MADGYRLADAVGHSASGTRWRRRARWAFPPLTPALSPLRGEGERLGVLWFRYLIQWRCSPALSPLVPRVEREKLRELDALIRGHCGPSRPRRCHKGERLSYFG